MFQNKVNHLGAVSLEYEMYIFKKMIYTEGGLLNYTRYWEDCNRPISCWSSTLDSLDTKLTMIVIWHSLVIPADWNFLSSDRSGSVSVCCGCIFSPATIHVITTLVSFSPHLIHKLCRHESSVIVSFNKRMLLSW